MLNQKLLKSVAHAGSPAAVQWFLRMPSSAVMLLLWQRSTLVQQRFASQRAHFTILCETVEVKSIIKSGEPIFLLISLSIWVNTFALQPYFSQVWIYLRCIQSFPPIITTLTQSPPISYTQLTIWREFMQAISSICKFGSVS